MSDTPSSLHDALIKIAVLETQLQGMRDNIELQAHEYERRLTELNHAHAQAVTDKQKFVNSDLFYAKIDEIAKWRSEFDQRTGRLVTAEMFASKIQDRETHFSAIEKRLAEIDMWRSRIIGIGIGGGLAGGAIGGMVSKLFE